MSKILNLNRKNSINNSYWLNRVILEDRMGMIVFGHVHEHNEDEKERLNLTN